MFDGLGRVLQEQTAMCDVLLQFIIVHHNCYSSVEAAQLCWSIAVHCAPLLP